MGCCKKVAHYFTVHAFKQFQNAVFLCSSYSEMALLTVHSWSTQAWHPPIWLKGKRGWGYVLPRIHCNHLQYTTYLVQNCLGHWQQVGTAAKVHTWPVAGQKPLGPSETVTAIQLEQCKWRLILPPDTPHTRIFQTFLEQIHLSLATAIEMKKTMTSVYFGNVSSHVKQRQLEWIKFRKRILCEARFVLENLNWKAIPWHTSHEPKKAP